MPSAQQYTRPPRAELEDSQVQLPDSGSLRGDLLGLLQTYAAHVESERGRAINRLIAGSRDHGQLGEWMDPYWRERDNLYHGIVERVVTRSELTAAASHQHRIELTLGPLLLHTRMTAQAIDKDMITDLAEAAEAFLRAP